MWQGQHPIEKDELEGFGKGKGVRLARVECDLCEVNCAVRDTWASADCEATNTSLGARLHGAEKLSRDYSRRSSVWARN